MRKKLNLNEEEKQELLESGLQHSWVASRPWNVVTAPGGVTIFTEGKGCRLTDINGKTYLDYDSGIFLVNIGYGRKEIADAIHEQAMKLNFVPTHDFSIPRIKLAGKLAELTPGDLWRVFFTSGGAEANEVALKIAKKCQRNSGFPKKWKIISRRLDYHGSTYASMSIGEHAPIFQWSDFEPLMPGVRYVEHPICRRCPFGLEYPGCDLQCAKAVERMIEFEMPETVAAVLMEPWSWTSGLAVLPPEYWPLVRSICDKYGVLLSLMRY